MWCRQIVEEGLARLRPGLAADVEIVRWELTPCGRDWRIRLECRWRGEDRSPRRATGRGWARLGPNWPPGDPRARRCVELALAQALAEVAMASGLGLAIYGWRLKPAPPCPRRGRGRAAARPAGGCGRARW